MFDWQLGSVFQIRKKSPVPWGDFSVTFLLQEAASCWSLLGLAELKSFNPGCLGPLFSPDNGIGWRGLGRQVAGSRVYIRGMGVW